MMAGNLVGQEPWELRGANESRLAAMEYRSKFSNWRFVESGTELYLNDTRNGDMAPISKAPIWVTLCTAQPPTGALVSTTFVDYPGSTAFTIGKQITNSLLLVQGAAGAYASVGNNQLIWGVQINGVDTEVCAFYFNLAGTHMQAYGCTFCATNLTAGTYTMKGRWRSPSGAQFNTDSNDRLLFTVMELPL